MKKLSILITAILSAALLFGCGKAQEAETPTESPAAASSEPVAASEPLNPTGGSVKIGDYTLTAEFIKLDEPITVSSDSVPNMDLFGDKLYIGDGKSTVYEYTFDGSKPTLVKKLAIENGNGISVDKNGHIYANGGVFAAKIYDGENQIGEAAAKGNAYMSQKEDFGLTYFSGRDEVTKMSGGASSPWVITNLKGEGSGTFKGSIKAINIVDDHVLVVGDTGDGQKLAVFDTAGNRIVMGTEKLFGNGISALTETANGYITASTGTIHLSAKDGTYIEKATATKALFGTENPVWIKKFIPLSDGSVLAIGGTKRADDTSEALLYKIKGF